MTAKEAIFKVMGWTEDAKDNPNQLRLPGFEPIKTPKNPHPSIVGMTGNVTAETPQSELEKHDKKNHPGGYKGGRCKVRGRLAAQGFDVRGYDARVNKFTAPEGYDYNEKHGEGDEDESVAETGEEIKKEEDKVTPDKVLPEPEKVEVNGDGITAMTTGAKRTAEYLQKVIDDPQTPPEAKEAFKKALEKLAENPATDANAADRVQKEEPKEEEEEFFGFSKVSDEQYEQAKQDPEASKDIESFKEEVRKFFEEGGELDSSIYEKGSIYDRVVGEVIEENRAKGQNVEEYTDSEVKVEEPKEETKPDEGQQEVEVEKQTEFVSSKEERPGLMTKKDWTPEQKAALEQLSKRFGASIEGIRKGVSDEKFSSLLNSISHFTKVKEKWSATPNVSPTRQEGRENLEKIIDNAVEKDYNAIVCDEINTLLGDDNISNSLKYSLKYLRDVMQDDWSSTKEINKAHEQYRKLCEEYGFDQFISRNTSGKPVQGYLEDGDDNHRKGGVVSSSGEYEDWKVDLNSLPDEKEGNGSVNNADEIKEKILDDLSKKNFLLDMDDIKETNFISTTDFSFKFPKDAKVSKSMIASLKQEITRNFPLAEDKGLSINYNDRTDTLTVTVENDNRGYVSQKRLLQSPEFQDAVKRGELAVALGLDDKGNPIIGNLTDYVHVLLAGQTGAGKSARLGSILSSLLMQSPDNFKMILIDPKKVEFGRYKNDPHLIGDVVTEGKEAVQRLNYLVNEQENRYRIFEQAGVSNLQEYNEKAANGTLPEGLPKHLPSIALVIDEFADLMDTNGKDVEGLVKRLGQKSRAAGVHLVLATQRPTAKNIPTDIRANIPTTIGMNVRDWRESGYVGIEGLDKIPQRGPLVIKTPDGKTTKVDGSFINGDGISKMVGLSRNNKKTEGSEGSVTKPVSESNQQEEEVKQVDENVQTIPQGTSSNEGATEPQTRVDAKTSPIIEQSYLDESELEGLDKFTRNNLKSRASQIQKLNAEYDAAPEGSPKRANIEAQLSALMSEDNEVRSSHNLRTRDAEGRLQDKSERPTEEGKPTEEISEKTDEEVDTVTTESPEVSASAQEEPVNTYIDEEEVSKVVGFNQDDLRENASDINNAYKILKNPNASREEKKNARSSLRKTIKDDNKLRKELGLRQRDGEGNLPKKEEPQQAASSEQTGAESEQKKERPPTENIYFNKEEAESITDEFDRADIEDGARRINDAISDWRENRRKDPDSKETGDAREAFFNAIKSDNEKRKSLKLPLRDERTGMLTSAKEDKGKTPPKGVDDNNPPTGGGGGGESANVEETTSTKETPEPKPTAPEKQESTKSVKQDSKSKEKAEEQKFDTPSNALTIGTEKYSPDVRKAMSSDRTLQALQANLVKAKEENGENSKEAKTAEKMLRSAQENFYNAYSRAQESNSGVEDIRTNKKEKKSDTEPTTQNKAESTPAKETSSKSSKGDKKKKAVRKAETPSEVKKRKEIVEEAKKDGKKIKALEEELDKKSKEDKKMRSLYKERENAAKKYGKESSEYKKSDKAARDYYGQLANVLASKEAKKNSSAENRKVVKSEEPKGTAKEEPNKENQKNSDTQVKKEDTKKDDSKSEPSKSEPAKSEPSQKEQLKSETNKTDASKSSKEEMTPQMKEYLERVEAKKKAEAEKQALIDKERDKKLKASEELAKRGISNRGLNSQSSQFAQKAMNDTDPNKSETYKYLTDMKVPEKIDNDSANEINNKLSKVSQEISKLQGELRADEDARNLSNEEKREKAGLIAHLRQGLSDILDKQKLGKGNFSFSRDVDQSGNINGLSIVSFKGKNGEMERVKPTSNKKKSQTSEENTTPKAAKQQEMQFSELEDYEKKLEEQTEGLEKLLKEIKKTKKDNKK